MTTRIPYHFERIFENYYKIQRSIVINRKMIENLYQDLSGVKGVDYSREKTSFNKDAHIEHYYQISDYIEMIEQENRIMETYINSLDKILNMITDGDLREAVRGKYMKEQEPIRNPYGGI